MSITIGILGGGQLAKMLMEAPSAKDLNFNILESSRSNSICSDLATNVIKGDLHDPEKIRWIVENSDVTTYELENINVDILIQLQEEGHQIHPDPRVLQMVQNKGSQKNFYQDNGINTLPFKHVRNRAMLGCSIRNWRGKRCVVKRCTGGYDGRGVKIVDCEKDSLHEFVDWLPCIIETYVHPHKELSVIVASDGIRLNSYPVVEMVFTEDNVLDYQICPARISSDVEAKAISLAKTVVIKLGHNGSLPKGIFAIEMFLTVGGDVYVNEMAPRPHNSGHHSIEGNATSQFEQLLRILTGKKMGETDITEPSLLINLLGPDDYEGDYRVSNLGGLNNLEKVHLHMYEKQPSKPGRKLGHLTVLGLSYYVELLRSYSRIVPAISYEVGVIMGSKSDLPAMQDAIDILQQFDVPFEVNIVSAHRTPERMVEYAKSACDRGLKVIIAGAGGAAHLPGMTASLTTLPVIGVPVRSSNMSGLDSLYSIVQMPRGVPVATMAINGSKNAGLFAVKILATRNNELRNKLEEYSESMRTAVLEDNEALELN